MKNEELLKYLRIIPVLCILVTAGFIGLNASASSATNPPIQIQAKTDGPSGTINRVSNAESSTNYSQTIGCNEPLTTPNLYADYSEPYCYGHDEAILGFISNNPGSGGNTVLNFTLPASNSKFQQGEFYATFWIGGVVYDPQSIDNQAFLEFQYYPVAPLFTGIGSGSKDCNAQGYSFRSGSMTSNQWFACAWVFALAFNSTSNNYYEYIPFAGPLESSNGAILVLNSSDLISMSLRGNAQSSKPWNISVIDETSDVSASLIQLKNGSMPLPPYYDTSNSSNGLLWTAAQFPALTFAFELGHSYSATDCITGNFSDGGIGGIPGDKSCDSYWPGRWSQMGLSQIQRPLMGTNDPTFPSEISFSSAQGGVSEIYKSSNPQSRCSGPSFSTATNCIYPFYVYEYNTSSFSFLSSLSSGPVTDFGNTFQYSGANDTTTGQWLENVQPAPNSSSTTVATTLTHTTTSKLTISTTFTTTVTNVTTKSVTSTVTASTTPPQYILTVEARSQNGSVIAGQPITLTNSTGYSSSGSTDNLGKLVFNNLSSGSTYQATANINGVTLSASVTLNGNSVIVLEPSPNTASSSSTSSNSQGQNLITYLPYIAVSALIAIGALFVIVRRRSRTSG
jgi:hypothetical protein